ncbi:MAG: hypothetical protein C0456_04035 [Hyphomonas sp.]|nr:hypothetical protein [Hyphomonas sp.]
MPSSTKTRARESYIGLRQSIAAHLQSLRRSRKADCAVVQRPSLILQVHLGIILLQNFLLLQALNRMLIEP